MPKQITIQLAEPLAGHQGPIATVVVREPRAAEFFRLGEPFAYARNADGTIFTVENAETVKAYLDALIVEPADRLLIEQLSLSDAMKVKETVLGFFTAARAI